MLSRCLVVVLATCGATGLLSGCGSGSSGETQPAPDTSTFTEGAFDTLPHYPRSDPAGPITRQDGVTVRSYTASSTTPERVLVWYGEQLHGWQVVTPPHAVGTVAWRGEWQRDRRRLLVSAAPSPTAEDHPGDIESETTQYSLTLGDEGVAVQGPAAGTQG